MKIKGYFYELGSVPKHHFHIHSQALAPLNGVSD
jgi:hypothetical protein